MIIAVVVVVVVKLRSKMTQKLKIANIPVNVCSQGRSDGGYIGIYTPPKSVYLKCFLCGRFVSLIHLYPPKSNSWLRPCLQLKQNIEFA